LQSEIDSLESLLAAAPSMERSKLRSLLRSTGIQERGIHLRSFQVFKNDGGFTKSFLELFSITELEHAELLKVSMYVKNEYYRLSKNNSRVSETEDGKMLVQIDPFDGAGELYSNLLQTFERVLGPDRYSDLLAFSEKELRERLLQFGGKKLEVYVFEAEKTKKDEGKRYLHVRMYEVEAKLGGGSGKTLNWGSILTEDAFSREFGVVSRIIRESQPMASGNAVKPPA